jgi:(p)ppGpp synthase/HD superfamily hydrolase
MRVAAVAHADDVRKGTQLPYISHPVHVARLLEHDGWPEEVIVAGLLHDVMEDIDATNSRVQDRFRAVFTPLESAPTDGATFLRALEAFLAGEFGTRVMRLVVAVTEDKLDASGNERPWEERKREVLSHLETADAEILALKAADVLHNAQSILLDLSQGQDLARRFNAPVERTLWYYQSVAEVIWRRMPECQAGTVSGLPKALRRSVETLTTRLV